MRFHTKDDSDWKDDENGVTSNDKHNAIQALERMKTTST